MQNRRPQNHPSCSRDEAESRKLPIIVGYDPRDIYNIDKNISSWADNH
jgi:hypothetical protein